ncbi:PREDICTED: cysteine proteinase inhibitor 1-like [Erythranthe guttata]|uniref:cysteine proteinase inhibitor 1-like n=1 Tax=Erythranthe guttata TaxID=4155 RepID=UPI00064D9082|nr:PREDICTED: cysteine proteinase inhibitor 1-like [Erythranthe guttata]|eukprot:XP_012838056.1 PREDICTED: cysteine proteinase inhibitor 1-like [Erythranthe guttata]
MAFGYKPGGMWPIENLKDPGVVYAAKFAVKEYNKKANTTLQFVTVIKGKQHTVAGSIYHLLILVRQKSTTSPEKYEVAISDRPWETKGGFKLESFKKLSKLIWIDGLNN